MTRRSYKKFVLFGLAIALLSIFIFWQNYEIKTDLRVSFLDVGQGDATLIQAPAGQNILIDGGPDNMVVKRLAEELSWWDRTIDLMILTHPHSDHVDGLVDVLRRYQVKKILYTGVAHNSPGYITWLKIIKEKQIPLIIIDHPQIIELGENCNLKLLYPFDSFLGKRYDNLNNTSLISRLDCFDSSFLLMGDAEIEVENELLATGVSLEVQVLKVGHHGSDTSSQVDFLSTVSPEFAVISVGEDNQFGHPSLRIIKRLERSGAQVLRTDQKGTIHFIKN